MSATISYLPSAVGLPDESAEPSKSHPDGGAVGDRERITRLIEIYQRLGSADRPFDGEAVGAALRALDAGREQDALELIEIAFEEPDASLGQMEIDDSIEESPIPDVAQTWRHVPRTAPACAGGTDAGIAARSDGLRLAPKRAMALDNASRWSAGVGDLDFDRRSCQATIDLGVRGELVLLLRSGAMTIDMGDALGRTEISCVPGTAQLVRLVYVKGRARTARDRPLTLHLTADPLALPQGIWCFSMLEGSSGAGRGAKDPEDDVVFLSRFQAITAATATAFCAGAAPAPMSDNYRHRSAADRGDFARYGLRSEAMTACGGWKLDEGALSTSVLGLMAVDVAPRLDLGDLRRELAVHEGRIELLVSLDGATWIAVSPRRRSLAGDDPGKYLLSPDVLGGGEHEHAFVTPLVSTVDGGFDVMLLRPNFGHAVWLTPGSQARLIHIAFDDPEQIVVKREKGRAAEPVASAGARRVTAG